MKKIYAVFMLAVMLFSGIVLVQAKQDQPKDNGNDKEEYSTIPEEDGIYDVPGHPELKVKVFVHKARGAKKPRPTPRPTPSPSSTPIPTPTATPVPTPSPTSTPAPTPACGLSDIDSTAPVGAAGWHLPTASWSYKINTASVPSSVGSGNLATIAARSFGVWSAASGISFNQTGMTTANRANFDGQNIIAWGNTSASALAVTYTTYYTVSREVVDVDTIMNQMYPWSWADQQTNLNCAYTNSYDAQDILTHELGHWMGLNDHYTTDYANNTMYGYGSTGEVFKDTLTTGDIAGINSIY